MKINLNLQEDKELRNEVKNLITGQVKKIIKEEIEELVAKEFNRKEDGAWKHKKVEQMYRDGLNSSIKREIERFIVSEEFCKETIKPYAEELIKRSIEKTDIESLVKSITKNMLNELVKNFA